MSLSSFGDLLEDRARLRALVETALTQLDDGTSASEVERQQIDLKEEAVDRQAA